MTIKICVSVPPQTVTEALDLIEKAENLHADFIEVRLDSLKKHDQLADIAHCSDTPLIATNRSKKFQGKFLGGETERKKILIDAARNGFEYVDIELSTPKLKNIVNNLCEIGIRPIVSFHDFNETPSSMQLNKILKNEIAGGADVCKIVTTARSIEDNLIVLDFVSKACDNARIICFAMGELGKPSRLLSPVFGAFFTIASLESGRKTAQGQLTIQEMRSAYVVLEAKVK
ncbi:MAG: type I 3-dehydroquinate dehydratase [Candidatus Bathyarchaeota archaeon]|nr:type I 3-dehydroquinate dehydratase [Candidatus Bathyarchaeota archaeon]